MFDPELFGQAMGEAIKSAVAPLQAKIADLEKQLAERPDVAALVSSEVSKAVAAIPAAKDGKDCDMSAVKALVDEAVKSLPTPKDGKDADPAEIAKIVKAAVDALPKPQDGKSVTLDDVQPVIKAEVEKAVALIPVPKDGAGVAGAMIDRDGNLNLTLTNGEVKNLGRVVGTDGVDGISLDTFDMEYLPETHEVAIKAVCAGRVKELRYPAGGIRPAGYWRDGSKAKAGDVWTRNGSMWIAKRDTSASPEPKSEDWYLAVQRGKDGESIVKTVREGPEPPIPLKGAK